MTDKPKRKYTRKPKVDAPAATALVAPVPVAVAAPEAPIAPAINAYMRKPVEIPPLDSSRHVMPIPVFKAAAARGGFIPYDGDGFYADNTHYDADASVWVVSQPNWATKVVWFNK